MKRLIIATIITLGLCGSAWAANKRNTFGELDVSADDYRWNRLSGASKNNNEPLTIEELSKVYKKLMAPVNPKTIWGSLQASTLERDVTCMKATGNERLCRCLGNELPVYLSFRSYVAIVTGEKNLNFSGLTAEEIKKMIEKIMNVREKCVTKSN